MFDLKKIEVFEEDIKEVEEILSIKFNDDQKKVLRFWSTTDIQACPGSGKTTTLAAKLIILAKKIPPDFQQGICIITHTNIAVKEIKDKLGSFGHFYFKYPNHFGTIQSFVDKYLAIPAYKQQYKHSPKIVDENTYDTEMRRSPVLQYSMNLIDAKNIYLGGLTFNKQAFIVSNSINDPAPIVIPGIAADKSEKHCIKIVSAKNTMLQNGYITYNEAYSLGFKYLRSSPLLKEIFSIRFPLVFIDEMQDMELHQAEIISLIFGGGSAVVQKIGDVNQAIFSRVDSDAVSEWKPTVNAKLQMRSSMRIANNLAEVVRDICIFPQEMIGWVNPKPSKPSIIVYTEANINQVKDKFCELILSNKLDKKGLFKCVGSRISVSKLYLNSYWENFNRRRIIAEFPNLKAYINQIKATLKSDKNVKQSRRIFLDCLCHVLKLAAIKNPSTGFYFTPASLMKFLGDAENPEQIMNIDRFISKSISKLKRHEDIENDAREFTNYFLLTLRGAENAGIKLFLTDDKDHEVHAKPEMKIYSYKKDNQIIDLHFDTIHGVKGETHTATLYLENFNRIFDIGGKILKFICADEKGKGKLRKEEACKKQLPLAYVALTRATHFFAIAVDQNRFTEDYKEYFENQKDFWDVHYV